jgi:hypothetical protein
MQMNNKNKKNVYYFFNEFERKMKNDKIHKVVSNDFYINNELTNKKKINKYNNFYLCENYSYLELTELDEDEEEIKKRRIQKDNTILLVFEAKEIIYLKKHLKALSSPTKYILSLIHIYKKMLYNLQILLENNIIHNHITFETIIVDKNDNIFLTNFLFSIDIKHENFQSYIKHFFIEYDPSYIEWPLEFHILSYFLNKKCVSLSNFNIETIINDFLTHNEILKTFGEEIVSSYKKEALNYFKKYVNQSYEFILNDICQYSYTWDNYALSILYLRILIGLHRSVKIKNKFIILFMKLLVSNIHLNPIKRFNVDISLQKFDSLLNILTPKDYKDLITAIEII